MTEISRAKALKTSALNGAIALPLLYWVNLILNSLLNPGYSQMRQQVSELGMRGATYPYLFNAGILVAGIALLVGTLGYYYALGQLGVGVTLSWLVTVVLGLFAVAILMAGFFPLPNPLHGGKYLGLVIVSGPMLLATALWRQPGATRLNAYLIITTILSVAILAIRMGAGDLVTRANLGLFQRLDAFVGLLWIGVTAYYLKIFVRQR